MQETAHEIETAGKEGDCQKAAALIQRLQIEFKEFRSEIEGLLSGDEKDDHGYDLPRVPKAQASGSIPKASPGIGNEG